MKHHHVERPKKRSARRLPGTNDRRRCIGGARMQHAPQAAQQNQRYRFEARIP